MSNQANKPFDSHINNQYSLRSQVKSKSSRKKSAKSINKKHIPQEEELIQEYYSRVINNQFVESQIGMPPSSFSSFSPDLGGLARMKKIILELRQELTQLTGRMSLQGEKRFTYHQKLLYLQNEIDRLIRSKEGVVSSLPVVLLDDEINGNLDSLDLDRRIKILEQRILSNQLETEREIASLIDQIKRKDRIIENYNDKVLAEVAASQAFQKCIQRIKDNMFRYKNQIGTLDRLVFDGVQFPNVGSYHIRQEILARDNLNYSRNRWVDQYRNQLLILFRQIQRLHNHSDPITQIQLERIIEGFLMSLQGSRITDIYKNSTINLRKMKDKFRVISALIVSSITRLHSQYPHVTLHLDPELVNTVYNQNISISRIENGVVFLDRVEQILIEVPTIEQRNIMMTPAQVVDIHFSESFNQQNDRLKNIAFHLRVLIKALLQQLDKMRLRTGYPLEIDERVINMINQEAGGIIDVEDVLRIFQIRAPQQHVIIESQPERIIEVPEVVIVDKIVQKIVQVQKIRQVQKVVNVPVEVPYVVENIIEKLIPVERIVQRIVEVPIQIQKLVQLRVQVPKVVEIEVQKIVTVPVDNIVEVEKNIHHVVPQPQQIQIFIQKIVPVQTIIQKIVQVPTIVQKIIQKVIRVPELIEVEVIVEKIVKQIEYVVEPEQVPFVQVQHKIVQKVIEKLIPIMQIQQRIVEVPQVIQKIIQVRTVQESIVEVQVLKQKLVFQDKIKEVEVIVQQIVPMIKQIQKVIENRVQIPIIVEKLVVVPQIVNKPIIQRVVQTIIQEVHVEVPVIIKQTQILQVDKLVNCFVEVNNVVKVYEDKIIQVPVYVDRIKEVRVQVDKIIEKIVEVPKIVEIEKIVEKIVVVPRVIESIKQIPQITEVAIDRVIVEKQLIEIQKIVQIPVIQQSIKQVEVIKNIYIPVQKIVQRVIQKLIQCPVYQQKVITNQIIQQRVVEVIRQIPIEIQVPQFITTFIQKQKVVEIEKNIIVPVQIPVKVQAIVEKIVPVFELKQNIVQVPQMIQKIIEIKVQQPIVHEVQQIINHVVVDTQIVSVPEKRVVIQQHIKQMPLVVQKIIPVNTIVDNIVPRQYIVQKVVQTTIEIPKVYQIQKNIQKVIHVPQVMEIQKLIPQIVRVNQVVDQIQEKIVQIPIIIQQLKEVQFQRQKIVAVSTIQQQLIEVERIIQKPIIMEKMKQVVRDIHHIEQQLKIIERVENVPIPIISREEKILQVPQILQKIVERIVIMPQVKQNLKYVHQITQVESLGAAVSGDVSIQQSKYKVLIGNLRQNINIVIEQLKRLMISQPHMQGHIKMLFTLLTQLDKLNSFSRIISVPVEKIVEKEVEVKQIVQVPVQNQSSLRKQVSLSLLVQKLINELTRIRNTYPNVDLQLEEDVKLIFLPQLHSFSQNMLPNFSDKLLEFQRIISGKFQSLGNWTNDHRLILNSFLEQRFVMANLLKQSNIEMQKIRMISQKRLQGLRRYKSSKNNYQVIINELIVILPQLHLSLRNLPNSSVYINKLQSIMHKLSQVQKTGGFVYNEPTKTLTDLKINDERVLSLLRQKQYEIFTLRQKLTSFEKYKLTSNTDINIQTINQLNRQIQLLKNTNSVLRTQVLFYTNNNIEQRNKNLNQKILVLEQNKADLENQVFNLRNQLETHINFAHAEIEQYKIRLSNSGITTIANNSPRRNNPSVASSFQSPVQFESNYSSRYVTDSLAFSGSNYHSGIPRIASPFNSPHIHPTQSATYSTSISPLNHPLATQYQHQSSFTARDNRIQQTIPQIAYSSISNEQYKRQQNVISNDYLIPQRQLHHSDEAKSFSVPGVNYDVPVVVPIVIPPSSAIMSNQPISINYEINQNSASGSLVNDQEVQNVEYELQLPQFEGIPLHQEASNVQHVQYHEMGQSNIQPIPSLSPVPQNNNASFNESQHNYSISQSIPMAPSNARQGTATASYHLMSNSNNLAQSNITPITVIQSQQNIVIPSQGSGISNPNMHFGQQIHYQIQQLHELPINQTSNIRPSAINIEEHIEYLPNQESQSHNSGVQGLHEDQQQQQIQYQEEEYEVQLESLPELHQSSQPIIHETHSEQHLPWPPSPNYDGLEQLSRGSDYSAYSGYSSRQSQEKSRQK